VTHAPWRIGYTPPARRDLRRLDAQIRARLITALEHRQLDRGHRHRDDQRQRRPAEQLDVTPAQEVPARDTEHHDRAKDQTGEDQVHPCKQSEVIRQQRSHARELRLAVDDLVADRMLHPRVRYQDEVGRQPRGQRRDPDHRQV
jgi:hypothetical protein